MWKWFLLLLVLTSANPLQRSGVRAIESDGQTKGGFLSLLQTGYWSFGSTTTGPPESWPQGPLPGAGSDCVFFCNGSFMYDMVALVLMALGAAPMSPYRHDVNRAANFIAQQPPTVASPPQAAAQSLGALGTGPPSPKPTPRTLPQDPPASPPYEPVQLQKPNKTRTATPTPTPVVTPVPCECSAVKGCTLQGSGMWAFGDNTFGQMGLTDRSNVVTPVQLDHVKNRKVVDFSIGWEHGIAVMDCGQRGNVVCRWGKHNYNRLGGKRCFQSGGEPQQLEDLMEESDKKVTQVAAGRSHTLAVAVNNKELDEAIFAWGNGEGGQLGNDLLTRQGYKLPAWVSPSGPETTHFDPQNITDFLPKLGHVIRLAAGPDHSAALFDSGTLVMWGKNNYGQCGVGHLSRVNVPTKVTGSFKEVSIGYDFTIALDSTGGVWGWGDNIRGQLGKQLDQSFTQSPVRLDFFDGMGITNISAGSYHAFAWSNKTVFAWGDNEYGQLGLGTKTPVLAPTEIPFFHNHRNLTLGVIDICGGRSHSAILTKSGDVFTWGANDSGQLGLGTNTTCTLLPQLVTGVPLGGFSHISCGYDTTFVW